MPSGKKFSRRNSNRLSGYDYSLPGYYFITVVLHHRIALFGNIVDGQLNLSEIGKMIKETWLNLPSRFPNIHLDDFVIMPNHFHGIVIIEELVVGAELVSAQNANKNISNRVGTSPTPTENGPTLGDIVRAFKSITTNNYIENVKNNNWSPFDRKLWQRNYYDRIIRNDDELRKIQQYIDCNPENWDDDEENLSD